MPEFTESALSDRGVDHLLLEYNSSPNAARKQRLEAFFAACVPQPATCADVTVKLARGLVEMELAGRVEVLVRSDGREVSASTRSVPDADLVLLNISDGFILSDQGVLVEGVYLTHQVRHDATRWLESGEMHYKDGLSSINVDKRTANLGLVVDLIPTKRDDVYFLFQARIGHASFGHYIFDTLAQLLAYDLLRDRFGDRLQPLFATGHEEALRYPGMRWLFERLVRRPADDCIYIYNKLYVRPQHAYTTARVMELEVTGISVESFRYLQQRIAAEIGRTPGTVGPRRVYVSRGDVGYREASNIADAELLLATYGFETIHIGDLSPQEAYDKISDAEVIAGMHGSGLMYHVYMRQQGTLIELAYPGYEWDPILITAATLGHRDVRVRNVGQGVDLQQLRNVLEQL